MLGRSVCEQVFPERAGLTHPNLCPNVWSWRGTLSSIISRYFNDLYILKEAGGKRGHHVRDEIECGNVSVTCVPRPKTLSTLIEPS